MRFRFADTQIFQSYIAIIEPGPRIEWCYSQFAHRDSSTHPKFSIFIPADAPALLHLTTTTSVAALSFPSMYGTVSSEKPEKKDGENTVAQDRDC